MNIDKNEIVKNINFSKCRKAALQGDAQAQFLLGLCYYYGKDVKQDSDKAAECFQKAAEQGFAAAQNSLGLCYEKGIGILKDEDMAARWFQKAAESGDAEGQYNYGLCLEKGTGLAKNGQEAIKWFQKAANQGFADATMKAGEYFFGDGRDLELAAKYFNQAIALGISKARNDLGRCYYALGRKYYTSEGKEADTGKAVDFFHKALKAGCNDARAPLGEYYFNESLRYHKGDGVKQDPALAADYFHRAAKYGHPLARKKLAQHYYDKGVNLLSEGTNLKNVEEAVDYFRKSKNLGQNEASARLGDCFYIMGMSLISAGDGRADEGKELIREASKLGNEDAWKYLNPPPPMGTVNPAAKGMGSWREILGDFFTDSIVISTILFTILLLATIKYQGFIWLIIAYNAFVTIVTLVGVLASNFLAGLIISILPLSGLGLGLYYTLNKPDLVQLFLILQFFLQSVLALAFLITFYMNEEAQFKILPYIVRIGKLLPWAIFFAMIIFDWIYKAEVSRYLDHIKSLHTEYYIMGIAGIILFSRFIEIYQTVKHEDI